MLRGLVGAGICSLHGLSLAAALVSRASKPDEAIEVGAGAGDGLGSNREYGFGFGYKEVFELGIAVSGFGQGEEDNGGDQD